MIFNSKTKNKLHVTIRTKNYHFLATENLSQWFILPLARQGVKKYFEFDETRNVLAGEKMYWCLIKHQYTKISVIFTKIFAGTLISISPKHFRYPNRITSLTTSKTFAINDRERDNSFLPILYKTRSGRQIENLPRLKKTYQRCFMPTNEDLGCLIFSTELTNFGKQPP